MDHPDTPAHHATTQAAVDRARARRHAIWLERLAVGLLALWITGATYLALGDPASFTLPWAATVTAALVAWGLLRALALLLHLRVDDAPVARADDSA